MTRLFKILAFVAGIGILISCISCIDDSLRDGSDRNSQTDDDKDNGIDNPGVVRVVTDPEAALAAANCIMVKPGQKVSIPIAKAFAVWDQYKDLLGKADMTKDMAPMLVWSYPDEMVDWDGLEIEDYDDVNKAVITFKITPGMKGNALVALTVDGTIRWSWHIWVTDYEPGQDIRPETLATGPNDVTNGKVYRYVNGAGDLVWMDRNLGANEADKTKGKETFGMYYQWGKKDPMPGFAPQNYYPDRPGEAPPEYDRNNLAYSIQHPDEFIVQNGQGDWYSYVSGTYDPDLWGSFSRKKTIWDPCPEGWKVPLYGLPRITRLSGITAPDYLKAPWHILEAENKFIRNEQYPGYESPVLGYWPAAGVVIGEPWYEELQFYWSGSDEMGNLSNGSAVFREGMYSFSWERRYGMSMRCVRISKENNDEK